MEKIKEAVADLDNRLKGLCGETVSQQGLNKLGLQNVNLRDYQLSGVNWLLACSRLQGQDGCILGDEMGLGKTLQTLSFILYTKRKKLACGPCLILSPLSVLSNWEDEFGRFAPLLNVLTYIGDKEKRAQIRDEVSSSRGSTVTSFKNMNLPFDVCLTSYEICLKDSLFFKRFYWRLLVVDEAHRLKNQQSLLHQELLQFDARFRLLLTGTPVQNNLSEVYSLLSFICPSIFVASHVDEFVDYFKILSTGSDLNINEELHGILKPFLLRRLKTEVVLDLPRKSEVVLYMGMSALQKKLYKAILTKDLSMFSGDTVNKTSLINILMHLRKCCNHPYIFPGVESEPFELGDHLIFSSGKLLCLDMLLSHLRNTGHRVLLFSQMTSMLDIVQDYLTYKGYTYERLDGSVRGEERYLAINKFNESDEIFIFLLSTRAGGQGLNLMTADTVIFLDSDFNPQNDLQAAARAHRIGQTRPVKVIRMVTKNSVEEIVLARAERKLKLTNAIIEGGQFSNLQAATDYNADELSDILKFGLSDLLGSEDDDQIGEELLSALGGTCNGQWLLEEDQAILQNQAIAETDTEENMYIFEGHDYSKDVTEEDRSAFDRLITDLVNQRQSNEMALRKEKKTAFPMNLPDLSSRKRRPLTEEEKEARRQKRLENAAKRARLQEEEEIKKAQRKKLKRAAMWLENGYTSLNIALDEAEEEEEEDAEGEAADALQIALDTEEDEETKKLNYVVGDVTRPVQTGDKDAIVIHCVDDSGKWGSGGLFSALSSRSANPCNTYELAGRMKDLSLGDAHLIPIDDQFSRDIGKDWAALIVAQTRDRDNRVSKVQIGALTQGLKRVATEALKRNGASVHLPRLGHNTPQFNWYGTEKLIKKELVLKGIPTFVYYYPRKKSQAGMSVASNQDCNEEAFPLSSVPVLPDVFSGITIYFSDVPDEIKTKLRRYVIAFDGDVQEFLSEKVTHVVCVNKRPTEEISTRKIVSVSWLEQCIAEKHLVNEDD